MSANRDEKSNVYIFPNSNKNNVKNQIKKSTSPSTGVKVGQIIKAGDLNITPPAHVTPPASVVVQKYVPSEMIGKRVSRPDVLPPSVQSNLALESLKQNFKTLNDLQARLRFMLQELEELVKE